MNELMNWLSAHPHYWSVLLVVNFGGTCFIAGMAFGDGSKFPTLWGILLFLLGCIVFIPVVPIALFMPGLYSWPSRAWETVRPDMFYRVYLTSEFKGLDGHQLDRLAGSINRLKNKPDLKSRLSLIRLRKIEKLNA